MVERRYTLAAMGPLALAVAGWWTGQSALAADDPTAKDLAVALQTAFAEAIERAEPSVVSVIRVRRPELDPLAAESFLRDRAAFPPDGGRRADHRAWPGDAVDPSWFTPTNPNYFPDDYGSGVIISGDGLVLTNHHVVEEADQLWVVLHDGKAVPARIWACDPRSDLAVLRVPPGPLKPIQLGDATKAKKGHFVLALGNSFAAARDGRASASWGIISNIARRLPPPDNIDDRTLHDHGTLLQTDARLNYGMSGGALVNLDGEMIGLTTSLAAVRGFDQAAGYAIPIDDTTRRLLAILREGREIEYGFLGVEPEDLPPTSDGKQAEAATEGTRVRECYRGCPAYQAGVQVGDIIVEVDSVRIRNSEDLIMKVGTRMAGTRVSFTVLRNDKRLAIPVILGKFPVAGQVIASVRPEPWRGLSVDYITAVLLPDRRAGMDLLAEVPEGGVVVREIEAGSRAAEAGLEPKTIITQVGGARVRTPAEFRRATEHLKGPVELTIHQGEQPKKLTVAE